MLCIHLSSIIISSPVVQLSSRATGLILCQRTQLNACSPPNIHCLCSTNISFPPTGLLLRNEQKNWWKLIFNKYFATNWFNLSAIKYLFWFPILFQWWWLPIKCCTTLGFLTSCMFVDPDFPLVLDLSPCEHHVASTSQIHLCQIDALNQHLPWPHNDPLVKVVG